MRFDIDRAAAGTLHEQIAATVRAHIAAGSLQPGDRLPPAADVARALDVNIHTVLRGYHLVRDEGLIEVRRGRGAVVLAAGITQVRVYELVDAAIDEARRCGVGVAELQRIVGERARTR